MKIKYGVAIAVLAFSCVLFMQRNGQAGAKVRETVYERVMRSGVLRCGYFEEMPFTIVDPNTGARSGIAVELAQRIARDLNIKIEWMPVSNFTTLNEDLRNGRYDAICASVFNLSRAGGIDYTMPYIYVPVKAYVQASRVRSLPSWENIDWTKTIIAGMDGEGATTIARQRLPQAQFSILPELSPISEMLTHVATGKADIALVTPTVFFEYARHNPGKLAAVQAKGAFHVFPVGFAVKPDEAALKNVMDIVIRNMASSGELAHLIDKYDPEQILYRPKTGYGTP